MNKKLTSYLTVFIVVVIFCNSQAFAQKSVNGTKELPLEINLLVESLQESNPENFDKILPVIMNIDLYARTMSKEDIFLLGKIEIYKTLLKNYDAPIKLPVDGVSVATLRLAINKTTDNFIKWFLQALLKDALDLTGSPVYKEFLLQKNNSIKTEKVEYRRLEKKAELLQFWISKVTPNAPDFPDGLRAALNPKMIEALKNIQNSFHLMAKEATLTPIAAPLKSETELKFFTVKNVTPKATPSVPVSGENKSVEDILAPITGTSNASGPIDLPKPTQENWLEDENTPPSLQNLPNPSNDADWLQDF